MIFVIFLVIVMIILTRSMLEIPFIIYTTEKFKMAYPQLDKQFSSSYTQTIYDR